MVKINEQWKELVLAARVVKGLIGFNQPTLIISTEIDLYFLKALLFATCTLDGLKKGTPIKDGIREFIHGTFN